MSYSIYNMGMHEYDISGKDPRSARRHISAEQFRIGDSAAYKLMYPLLYRQVGKVVDRDDEQDVTQDVLEKLVKYPPREDADGNVLPWTMTVATRTAIDSVRKTAAIKRGRGLVEAYGLAPTVDTEYAQGHVSRVDQGVDSLEVRRVLERAVPNPGIRAALMLVDGEGLSYKEAAAVLQIPLGTLQSRVNRGRSQAGASDELRSFYKED